MRNSDSIPPAIAVTGIACRYPGAENPQEFWENIVARRCQFRQIPDCRLPMKEYHHPDRTHPDTTYGDRAAVIDGFEFDWAKRRIPISTYQTTDIVHWLALETCLDAVKDAGYTRKNIPGDRCGVLVGNTLTGEQTRSISLRLRWPFVKKALFSAARKNGLEDKDTHRIATVMEGQYKSVFARVDEDTLAGGLSNTIAGRICNYLNLNGGGYTIDGACSSSLLASATAMFQLVWGELDMVIVGGVDVSLDPFELVGFSKTGALTQGDMMVYDRRGKGFIPGEGCGFIIMKRLEDARRDNDYLYAVIRGWGISSDGAGAGITAPNAGGQALAIQRAYAKTPFTMEELDFIEGHGTGTMVGDKTELEGIALAMGESPVASGTLRRCGITSLKSIIGHTKAASGIGGLIKAILALNRRVVPPTASCAIPHPAFETAARRIYPVLTGRKNPADQTMYAGVSSMGFGGINCHIALESGDAPKPDLAPRIDEQALLASAQDSELFIVGGKDHASLLRDITSLIDVAKGISIAELTDLAFRCTREIETGSGVKAALVAGPPGALIDRLSLLKDTLTERANQKSDINNRINPDIWVGTGKKAPRIGFLFPGQGSQKLNMGRMLNDRFPWAQALVAEVRKHHKNSGPGRIDEIIYQSVERARDPEMVNRWAEILTGTENAQPAICLTSLLWIKFLSDLGIKPSLCGGHSLGELTALYAAGVFSEDELLRFAVLRGRIMAENFDGAGAMASLKCPVDDAMEIASQVKSYITIANINSPLQTVLSGDTQAVNAAVTAAMERGIAATVLPVTGAFHSRLMEKAAAKIGALGFPDKATIANGCRLFSSMKGAEITGSISPADHFARQIVTGVNFDRMVRRMADQCDIFLEVGPGRVLTGLAETILKDGATACLPVESNPSSTRDLNRLLAALFVHGISIKWDALYENRLVRPFVPSSDKIYIENPCSKQMGGTPVPSESADPSDPTNVSSALIAAKVLESDDGISKQTLSQYLAARSPFLEKMIQADIQYWVNEKGGELQAHETAPPVGEGPRIREAKEDFEAILYQKIEDVTGFDRKSISPESRLLDDLNLDSIKAGDLIAGFAESCGVRFPDEPSLLANATLKELTDAVLNLKETGKARILADPLKVLMEQAAQLTGYDVESVDPEAIVETDLLIGSEKLKTLLSRTVASLGVKTRLDLDQLRFHSLRQIAEILKRIAREEEKIVLPEEDERSLMAKIPGRPWVRRYTLTHTLSPLAPLPDKWHQRAEDNWHLINALVIHAPESEDVAEALKSDLILQGARATRVPRDRHFDQDAAQDAEYSHVFSILPKSSRRGDTHPSRLRAMIAQHAAVSRIPDAAVAPRRRTTLCFIQFGGGFFGRHDRHANIDQGGTLALAESIHLERADLRVRVVDVSPLLSPEIIARTVVAEVITPEPFAAAGYDHKQNRRVIEPFLSHPENDTLRDITWSPQDLILSTGGAKGITASCTLAAALETGARAALVGSSPHPDNNPETREGNEITEALQSYKDHGLEARYFSCDVTDKAAVDQLIDEIEKEMGPVTAVIHGAGVNIPRPAKSVDTENALKEVSPKVLGAMNLLSALEAKPPKIIIGMGSIIGVAGMPGNAWYGFSNEALDLLLRRFAVDYPETDTLTIAYSIWRDEGMGARMGSVDRLKRQGIGAIPSKQGVEGFVRLFTHDPGSRQVVVTSRLSGLDTWRQPVSTEIEGARYLETLVHHTPGVESVYSARLSLKDDPYLRDHQFQGSYLFPAVFGLEAMAQAVAHVSGTADFSRVQIQSVRLMRPITVDPEKGADLMICAVKAQRQDKRKTIVNTGIVKLDAGTDDFFFSASFVLDPGDDKVTSELPAYESPLPIDPKLDLYRDTLLFQGEAFQRIDQIYAIHMTGEASGTAVFTSIRESSDRAAETAFPTRSGARLFLGDPFFRDSLLQSSAILSPQDISLPVKIDQMDIYPRGDGKREVAWVTVTMTEKKEKAIGNTVFAASSSGDILETLNGYGVQILKHHDEYPRVSDLTAPQERDFDIIQTVVSENCAQLWASAPKLFIQYIPGIHAMKKTDRHAAVNSLMETTASGVMGRDDTTPPTPPIKWDDRGKPYVEGDERLISISLSHDDRLCLCTAGDGPLGCDVAPVTKRNRAQWDRLLGKTSSRLLEPLLEGGDSLDCAGTRIWAALETAIKASSGQRISLEIVERHDQAVLFRPIPDKGDPFYILAVRVHLTWGPEKIIAVTVAPTGRPVPEEPPLLQDYPGYDPLYDTRSFETLKNGPQGQLMFAQRFPVTFQPSAQLSRTIYFSNYIKWMGNTREASAWPVLGDISKQFASGKWGGVTNFGNLKILGEGGTSDQIEVRMWISDNSGPENSTMTLTYDFRKIVADGYERLALCTLQTTWVEILGPGKAKTAPYPPYYDKFILDMCPQFDAPNTPEALPESLAHLHGDEPVIYRAPEGPVVQPVLREQTFETTLAQANLVGNIYYANYYEWQGQIRDRYLYDLIPEYYSGTGERGELLCLESRVDHLREAMPFDRILLTLALKALTKSKVLFHIEYFRIEPDNRRVKIAHGHHQAVWVKRDENGRPFASPFPAKVQAAFKNAISI